MRPLRIRAQNLRTWAELDVEVPTGIAAIVGPNGAGKSSLVEVVDLALFGTGRELARATTRGFDDVMVELLFQHGLMTYRVTRSRKRGKPTLDLAGRLTGRDEVPWTPLTAQTITVTQEVIEEILGLSRQTFRASSFLAQGDGAAFTTAEPRDRKAILLDALGVRVWDRLREKASGIRSEREKTLEGVRAKLALLEEQLREKDSRKHELGVAEAGRAGAERALRASEVELDARKQELAVAERAEAETALRTERLNTAKRRRDELAHRDEQLASLVGNGQLTDEAVTELRAKVKRGPLAETMILLESEYTTLDSDLTHVEGLQERLAVEEKRLAERTDALVEELDRARDELRGLVVCPTCGQKLDEAGKRRASEALRARVRSIEDEQGETLKRATEAREEAARLATERAPKDARVKELLSERHVLVEQIGTRRPQDVFNEAREAERELATLEERTKHVEAMREERAAIGAELAELDEKLPGLLAAYSEVAGTDAGEARGRAWEAEAAVERAREVLRQTEERLTRARERMAAISETETEARQMRKDVEEVLEPHVALLRLAERAFGRDGIPSLILETSAIPHLEAEANRIVSELGREYRFELRTQRETQAGGVKDVLDVVVHTGEGEAVYEDFSGGEKTRLDLSLRIALARLLSARRGSDVRLLAIDEPAYLDEEGFGQLAAVLRGLENEFDSILVVSHVDTLRDAFDHAIIVGGGADTGEPSRLEEV